jgi:hypothetical protein
MSDEELVKRPLDEEFDTMMEVQRNPCGAWQAIQTLTAERDELQQVFDFQWRAHMRAVEMWRTANPGNDLVLPDSAKLTVWMLEQLEAARADAKEAEAYAEGLEKEIELNEQEACMLENDLIKADKEIDNLKAKLAKAVEALTFYANEENYKGVSLTDPCGCCSSWYEPKIHIDGEDSGHIARATLAEIDSSEAVTPYGLEGEKG